MVPCQKISQCYGPYSQINWGKKYINRYRKFNKIRHIFLTADSKIRLQGSIVSLIKGIYEKCRGNCRTSDALPVCVHRFFIWRPRVMAPARGVVSVVLPGSLAVARARVVACGLGSCAAWTCLLLGVWDLNCPARGWTSAPCVAGQIRNHCTTDKVPWHITFKSKSGMRQGCLLSALPLETVSVLMHKEM